MRRVILAFSSLLGLVATSYADEIDVGADLPALFDVAGVADPDVLNVRAEPDAAADIVGTLENDAERVEVVDLSEDSRWGLVNVAEASGYVAMRYLEPREIDAGPEGLPSKLACFGTEPFWSLSVDEADVTLSTPESGERVLSLDKVLRVINVPQPNHVLFAELDEARYTAVIDRAECSDGMSDRRYGLAITFIEDSKSAWAAGGCCSLR